MLYISIQNFLDIYTKILTLTKYLLNIHPCMKGV